MKTPQSAESSKVAPTVSEPFAFLDLKTQFQTIREDVMAALGAVLDSQHFILGSEVRLLEQELAAHLNAGYAVSCASGSDALLLAMMALGIGPGDEVITSPFTFFATAGSIARLGAKPVFVDIDPSTFNVDVTQIEAAITPKTRALMPVHLFGLPAEMGSIVRLAKDRGVRIVEDAAQAMGARISERGAGTLGEFGCFSFFPSKNLGCFGDGGLVITQQADFAERIRILRVHGSNKKYYHQELGINSRLDAIQAAILRIKLRHLDHWTSERRNRADHYRRLFESAHLEDKVILPREPADGRFHVYNQFVIRSSHRDDLRSFLEARRIPTEIYYPLPLHLQPAFAYLGYRRGELPQAEAASDQVLALPIYPELKNWQQEVIVDAIAEFYAGHTDSAKKSSSLKAASAEPQFACPPARGGAV